MIVTAKVTSQLSRLRVVFVDDDACSRSGYAEYLDGCGFEVYAVGTGEEALTVAAGWTPDVIVLDLGLPDTDGWEVARRLKASPKTAAVPIIALTGATLPHERASAMRAGCDRYLPKPCVPTDLLHAIRCCVGKEEKG
jgi:CheY-like chemotaxis protein